MKGDEEMSKPSNEEITRLTNDIYQKLCSMGANPEDAKEIVQESLYRGFLNSMVLILRHLNRGFTRFPSINITIYVEKITGVQ